jgi:penicillin-binding protein 1A
VFERPKSKGGKTSAPATIQASSTQGSRAGWRKKGERLNWAMNAWFDSATYGALQRLREAYVSYAHGLERAMPTGWARRLAGWASEGVSWSVVGAAALLALAQPAFRETSEDWLKKQELAVTFLDRYGVEVGRRGIRHDDSIPLEQLPDHLIAAVLATEDRRFYDHFGIDVLGTLRAVTVNARSSGVVQGGSSLTQQLAKNLFLTNERTLQRKINEAFLSLWLEAHLSKREILKLYLDRAYMGGGSFGVQAAANFYFGKSARDLTLAESAMLAGLFKAPTKYAPHVNLPAARGRAGVVLDAIVAAGFMSEGQVEPARRNPATAIERKQETSPDWYLDWAFTEVKKLADAGKLGDDRVLTVRTALDSGLEAKAQQSIEDNLRQFGAQYHVKQAATVVVETSTGAVRAVVGGRDYGASQFNRAVDALRQPGSSFKPYVYLSAMLYAGKRPNSIVVDRPICIGNWCPRNYGGGYAGAVPLSSALARSLNTVAVQLTTEVGQGSPKAGRARVVDTARRMGVTAALTDTVSLPLGAGEISVLEHSAAYATFANGGKRVEPHAALEIRNSRGDTIWRHERDGVQPVRVFPEATIADMNSMLVKVVDEGTGGRAKLGPEIRVGGKTGTTSSYRDAWFCGFTGNYSSCIWFGNDDYQSTNNMTGGSLPAQTWRDFMAYAHQNVELRAIPGAPVEGGRGAAVASVQTPSEAQPQRMNVLTRRSAAAVVEIERGFERAAAGQRLEKPTAVEQNPRMAPPARRVDAAPVERRGRVARLSDGAAAFEALGGGHVRIYGGEVR